MYLYLIPLIIITAFFNNLSLIPIVILKANQEIKKYRRFEKRLKLRNSINKKIPFFKKIRFQSLKK